MKLHHLQVAYHEARGFAFIFTCSHPLHWYICTLNSLTNNMAQYHDRCTKWKTQCWADPQLLLFITTRHHPSPPANGKVQLLLKQVMWVREWDSSEGIRTLDSSLCRLYGHLFTCCRAVYGIGICTLSPMLNVFWIGRLTKALTVISKISALYDNSYILIFYMRLSFAGGFPITIEFGSDDLLHPDIIHAPFTAVAQSL